MPVTFKRNGDAESFDPELLRRDGGGGGITLGFGKAGPRLQLKGEHITFMVMLLMLVFYLLGAFAKFGLESPIIPKNGAASSKEHDAIVEELQISQYLLTECLRGPASCPKLSTPNRLRPRLRAEGDH